MNEDNPSRIERLREVQKRTGKSRSAIYADMARGVFPRAVKISDRAVGWRSEQIDSWIASLRPVGTKPGRR